MSKWLPLTAIPLFLGSLCLAPCLPHDVHLISVERRYRAIAHPPDSRSLARESDLGLLEGNGNHCDYFVGELRATHLTRAELEKFYGAHTEIEVLEQRVVPPYVSSPRDRLQLVAARASPAPGELLYIAFVFDQEAAGEDIRCH